MSTKRAVFIIQAQAVVLSLTLLSFAVYWLPVN